MRWMWIDTIVAHEPNTRLVAIKNVSLAEEHIHDHFPASTTADGTAQPALPVMPGPLIIEGMAQTAGILVGAARDFTEKVVLAKIASVSLERDVPPGCTIRYDAELIRIDDAGASTRGTVCVRPASAGDDAWTEIGVIELMFGHLDQNRAGTEFPDDNFVFSDNFTTILGAAGLTGAPSS